MTKSLQQKWDAKNYHNNSSVQYHAASQVIDALNLTGDEHILDIGCGDGKITYKLAKNVPRGKVVGLDPSESMLSFARESYKNQSNLSFELKKAQEIKFKDKFDLIFSSFALQWVPEIELFVAKTRKILKEAGRLAFIIPLDISPALEQSIDEVIKSNNWFEIFTEFKKTWYFRTPDFYEELLFANKYVSISKVEKPSIVFESLESFTNYISQWMPHMSYLQCKSKKESFLEAIVDNYLLKTKQTGTGKVIFSYSHLNIWAQKLI